MAMNDYETRSDPFTEKEDDFDPSIYADGSVNVLGAFYTWQANSLVRIEAASMKNERLRNKMVAMEHPDVYLMLIGYLSDERSEAVTTVRPWDGNHTTCFVLVLFFFYDDTVSLQRR